MHTDQSAAEHNVSRRNFLGGAGTFAAGALVAASSLSIGCDSEEKSTATPTGGNDAGNPDASSATDTQVVAQPKEIPAWPWSAQYVKLDPAVAAKLGYDGYKDKGGCCYGAFHGIIGQLAKDVGFPFTQIPTRMMKYGEGGGVGWGTLCGALNGAAAAVNVVVGGDDYAKIINDVFGWYTTAMLPIYVPDGQTAFATSKSGSTLCHASVTNWCKASGKGASTDERKERCARVVADVVAYTVKLLNDYKEAKFAATFTNPVEVTDCMACHGPTLKNNTQGKMACLQCHDKHN